MATNNSVLAVYLALRYLKERKLEGPPKSLVVMGSLGTASHFHVRTQSDNFQQLLMEPFREQ
jgi:hypothetical protein